MTRDIAEKWVGRTIWQLHADGTPVSYEFIGAAKRPDQPVRFVLHILRSESMPERRWDPAAPSFLSREAALENALTQEDRSRLAAIERNAFARRGFPADGTRKRPRPEPVELDLFTYAAKEAALRTGRTVTVERRLLLHAIVDEGANGSSHADPSERGPSA